MVAKSKLDSAKILAMIVANIVAIIVAIIEAMNAAINMAINSYFVSKWSPKVSLIQLLSALHHKIKKCCLII